MTRKARENDILRPYAKLGAARKLDLKTRRMLAIVLGMFGNLAAQAAAPSLEDFASRPRIEDVSISPDGRYVALIGTRDGKATAFVEDRQAGKDQHERGVIAEPDHFQMTWCRWATNTRLLCGFRGMVNDRFVYGITRLVAVDADGKNVRVLMQNSMEAQGQFQDRIIDWNPGPPDTVLIEADEGLSAKQMEAGVQVYGNVGTHALPAVFELDVVTGRVAIRQHAHDPIRHWITDKHGHVRLGWGFSGTTRSYWARLDGDSDWRRLTKFEVFTREDHFEPVAISAEDPNWAYALGPSGGHTAIWLIDLRDKEDPKLVFSHPIVDVSGPVLGADNRLIGVRYDDGYPLMYFEDGRIGGLMKTIQALEPGQFDTVHGSSRDEKLFVVRSVSDVDAPRFMLFNSDTHELDKIGRAYPDRDPATLASMRPISYPARDGTRIPAYLSVPRGATADHLPLVVMPHGGPMARDTWGYFFLREFLVSRGYAVLQMNFRGSSGYGDDWFFAAHQDWGGLTYDDVIDGARWAIQQGFADPKRICIAGWSFGGYLALLGAQRNPDIFRCAVDIAGPSDLALLIEEGHHWLNADSIKRQIGTNPDKLKRDSPRLHAADFQVPLLILQGKMDAQVPFQQSEEMDQALTHAGKPHRFVAVADADHQFSAVKDRLTLLQETDAFLREHLPAEALNAP
jgi:dipeptidyl aminopeptidase/acylaminoacyl peptidase